METPYQMPIPRIAFCLNVEEKKIIKGRVFYLEYIEYSNLTKTIFFISEGDQYPKAVRLEEEIFYSRQEAEFELNNRITKIIESCEWQIESLKREIKKYKEPDKSFIKPQSLFGRYFLKPGKKSN